MAYKRPKNEGRIIVCPQCGAKNMRTEVRCVRCDTELRKRPETITEIQPTARVETSGISASEGCASILIKCRKNPLQWLITKQPYCIVNSVEKVDLKWGAETRIPLQPNLPYQLKVEFPYMGKACMPASLVVTLKEGEVQEYLYSTMANLTVFANGKIVRTR